MGGGRLHNVCGERVEEVVVDIDARAEFTIAAINLERLKAIEAAFFERGDVGLEFTDLKNHLDQL